MPPIEKLQELEAAGWSWLVRTIDKRETREGTRSDWGVDHKYFVHVYHHDDAGRVIDSHRGSGETIELALNQALKGLVQ